jgi:HK97 family phage portal protein
MISSYLKKFFKPKVCKSQTFLDFSAMTMNTGFSGVVGPDSYCRNVIVYRCVNLIASSASHVPWMVKKNRGSTLEILDQHPAYNLLKRPNPEKAGADFFSEVIASKLLFGNSYILSSSPTNMPPIEIYLLPSSSTEIILNQNYPVAYRYYSNKGEKIYNIDPISRVSKILHIKNYHPNNQHYGLPCLTPASMPIDLHMESGKWNSALLKNGARPSGALIVKDNNGYLNEEQFERLKDQLYEKFTGSANSGKPLLLEGGLDWKEMSISPKDMDFIESKNTASREIALAFGVPPQLLGINGDNTYSNMQEARLGLWEETLIPLLDKLSDSLSNWLSYWYQDEIIIDFDRDEISALTEKRQNLWDKISSANFMTVNEKRGFVGLKPIKGGDII